MEAGQVGAKLRDARVARGLSLEDIASTTKVPRSMLALLELDAFQKMPAPVFVRGFIRSYAKVVGVDANPIVRAYEHRTSGLDPIATPQPEPEPMVREPRNRVGLNTDRKLTPIEPLSEPREGMFRGGYALLAVVAVGLLIAAWLMVGGKHPMSETTSARVNDPIGLDGSLRDDNVPSLDGPTRPERDQPRGSEAREPSPWTSVPRDEHDRDAPTGSDGARATQPRDGTTPRASDDRSPTPRVRATHGGGDEE